MNNKWKNLTFEVELGGWTTIPNILIHNYKQLGLNAEIILFVIDIISNSEDFKIYDTYMSTHATSKTLRDYRNKLKKLGYLTWERFNKCDIDGKIVSSGFIYNLDGLIAKIIQLKEDGEKDNCPKMDKGLTKNGQRIDQKWTKDVSKGSATKESYSEGIYPKQSINNIRPGVSGQSPSHTGREQIKVDNMPLEKEQLELDALALELIDIAPSNISRYLHQNNIEQFNFDAYYRYRLDAGYVDNNCVDTYLQNISQAEQADELEMEIDCPADRVEEPEAFPSEANVKQFIYLYKKNREAYGFGKLKNIGSHLKNIRSAPAEIVSNYIDSQGLDFIMFFKYCDDKTFNMDIRHFECNSNREPSVMVNESVHRRFVDWYNKKEESNAS